MDPTSSGFSVSSSSHVTLERILSIEGVFHREILACLTFRELGRLERVSKKLKSYVGGGDTKKVTTATVTAMTICCWEVLCQRDYYSRVSMNNSVSLNDTFPLTDRSAPSYDEERKGFLTMRTHSTWKETYKAWRFFDEWTNGTVRPVDIVRSIRLWNRLEACLYPSSRSQCQNPSQGDEDIDDTTRRVQNVLAKNIRESLGPCPSPSDFRSFREEGKSLFPSPLLAFYACHGGQSDLSGRPTEGQFFSALLGSYRCYNTYYAMRLISASPNLLGQDGEIAVGISMSRDRLFLTLSPRKRREEMTCRVVSRPGTYDDDYHDDSNWEVRLKTSFGGYQYVVCNQGILSYMEEYANRLERGIYKPSVIIDDDDTPGLSAGISLFPDAGETTSRCVTRSVEITASARWIPDFFSRSDGLNFGYSIRMRLVDRPVSTNSSDEEGNENSHDDSILRDGCQLIGRHWEFRDGNGEVRRVSGEAVIGLQPRLFVTTTSSSTGDADSENPRQRRRVFTSGYIDLGPHGTRRTYPDRTFVYQSQSGVVRGTAQDQTGSAQVQGSFTFVPGSIQQPKGPVFHVRVAPFPLTTPSPFF